MLLTMLEDGRIHLCGITVIPKHLTESNCKEVLARATHKNKRALEELVAELAPKPDVPHDSKEAATTGPVQIVGRT